MNQHLEEINGFYIKVQDYVDPTMNFVNQIKEEEWADFRKKGEQFHPIYMAHVEKLKSVIPSLSHAEIIEGYEQGTRLLQRNLSGYMAHDFSHDYIPTMTNAVKEPHLHTAWLFLQVLADHLGNEILPLVIEALDIQGVNDTALSIVEQLHIVEALPKVHILTQDSNSRIAFLADQVSKSFKS